MHAFVGMLYKGMYKNTHLGKSKNGRAKNYTPLLLHYAWTHGCVKIDRFKIMKINNENRYKTGNKNMFHVPL